MRPGRPGAAAAALVAHLELGFQGGADQHEPVDEQGAGHRGDLPAVRVEHRRADRVADVHHVLVVGDDVARLGHRVGGGLRVEQRELRGVDRGRARVGDRLPEHVDVAAVGHHLERYRGGEPRGGRQERVGLVGPHRLTRRYRDGAARADGGHRGLIGHAEADRCDLARERQRPRVRRPVVGVDHARRTAGTEIQHRVVDPAVRVHGERQDHAVVPDHHRESIVHVGVGLHEKVGRRGGGHFLSTSRENGMDTARTAFWGRCGARRRFAGWLVGGRAGPPSNRTLSFTAWLIGSGTSDGARRCISTGVRAPPGTSTGVTGRSPRWSCPLSRVT